jgi:hypothetical protein
MTEPRTDRDTVRQPEERFAEPIRYPTNHVVAVVDGPAELRSAYAALADAGFLESEIGVSSGQAAAEALEESSGRTGLAGLVVRIAERFGVSNGEMAMKDRYEQALREGRYVVSVLTPTDERKDLAARILRDHGAHWINFLGRFSIETFRP